MICGQAQVKCVTTLHTDVFSCIKIQTHTPSKQNGPFANLRQCEMSVLAFPVSDSVSKAVCLDHTAEENTSILSVLCNLFEQVQSQILSFSSARMTHLLITHLKSV